MVQPGGHSDMNMIGSFMDYLLGERGLSESTANSYQRRLWTIETHIGKKAEDVTVADMRHFLRSADYKPATKHGQLVALKRFHQWGALEEKWPLNGIMSIRGPKVPDDTSSPLTKEDARDVLEACGRANAYRVIYLGLYGGLRVFESAQVTEENWLEDKLVIIGKGNKRREVPVHPELARHRKAILSCRPTDNTLKQTCRAISLRLQTPMATHTLRRTFADMLYNEVGTPWEVVASLLGHALGVTGKYTQPRFPQKVEAVMALDYYS